MFHYMDKTPLKLEIVCLFLGVQILTGTGTGTSEKFFHKLNDVKVSQEGPVVVRSLLDCSQQCSRQSGCCGVTYGRNGRLCCMVDADRLASITVTSQGAANIYLNDRCTRMFQEMSTTTSAATSTTGATTSPGQTTSDTSTQTTVTTSQTTSQTSTTTPMTSRESTTTTTPVTSHISTSTTTPMTSRESTTTTTPVTSHISTSTTTPMTSTTSTTTTTTTTTTTVSTSCDVHALVCTSDKLLVITSDSVLQYDDYTSLTNSPVSRQNIASVFPRVQGTIVAAYADIAQSEIYVITGSSLQAYSSDALLFKREATLNDHFGVDNSVTINAALQYDPTTVYIFFNDTMQVVSSGSVRTLPLDNNGSQNPYRCDNHADRPLIIAAACAIDADSHVFLDSNGHVYTFRFSEGHWNNVGPLICQ